MEKQQIKMIGLDLDGTLLNLENKITDYTRKVLEQTIDKGITVVVATGRPLTGIPKEIRLIPEIRYVLVSNGARVFDLKEDQLVLEKLLLAEDVKRALTILNSYDALREIVFHGVGYIQTDQMKKIEKYTTNPHMEKYVRETRKTVDRLEDMLRETKDGFDKINCVFLDSRERKEAFNKMSGTGLALTYGNERNMEINQKQVNKGSSLIELAKLLGIERQEVMAFGDGVNDLEMLREVGLGVAMDNAMKEVKEVADTITYTNDQEGVARAIEQFVL
ncbi:Cof-type HAD-IIB family hydrolase [Enterococcus pallens]|uniref:Cof-like hydrolase n=1 Tax=Enterococcus pallens ATCC BAA-351 TaxID=1158607 RepID=R2SRX9_9ENTE|nr:Cof-type HAD-IIB family hydrolase [Enterococcus pallens]EOH95566.1 cof-like hydrolase [Enterococcus pallens ATCC BAA-351]EOU21297.1 hypothetical protein I588_02144 [Enterococcus pallens ATCC BAA-351]OJG78814.1 cof-like hydrolase [Enterococcus pallens]